MITEDDISSDEFQQGVSSAKPLGKKRVEMKVKERPAGLK